MIRFIAMDPSMANTAIVEGTISNGKITPLRYRLSQTKKTPNKQIRASSDMVRRCGETIEVIKDVLEEFKPQICFVETPSGSQNSKAAQGYGISCCFIALMNPPAIQITPIELKKLSLGNKTATKKEMISWANKMFPNFLEKKKNGQIHEGRMEHVADALACVYAGIQTNQYKQLIAFTD